MNRLTPVIFLMIIFVLGNTQYMNAQSEPSKNQKSEKVIRISGDADYAPYVFINHQGEPDGFSIQLLKVIMKRLHLRYEIQLKELANAMKDLREGRADVISSVGFIRGQHENLYFTQAHSIMKPNFVRRKDTPMYTLRDLNTHAIVTLKDGVGERILSEGDSTQHLIPMLSVSDALANLNNTRTSNLMLCSQEVARLLIDTERLHNLEITNVGFAPCEICFGGSDPKLISKINSMLYELRKDGTYDTLYNKWFQNPVIEGLEYKISALLIVFLGIFLIISIYLLWQHRTIRSKNRDLDNLSADLQLALAGGEIMVWWYDSKSQMSTQSAAGRLIKTKNLTALNDKNIHPDDKHMLAQEGKDILEGKKENVDIEFRMMVEPEVYHYCRCNMRAKVRNGIVKGLTGTLKDVNSEYTYNQTIIEKNKRLEAYRKKIQLIIHHSHITVWEYDRLTGELSVDGSNQDDQSQMTINRARYRMVHHDDLPKIINFRKTIMNGRAIEDEIKIRMRIKPDGPMHYFIIGAISTDTDKDGIARRYVGYSINISPLQEMKSRLEVEKKRADLAEIADKLKSEFLANMSHEIRTPLNAIVGFAQLMGTAETEEEQQEFMEIINTNSMVLLRVIDDILTISKLEAGLVEISLREFDLNELVDNLYASFKLAAENKDIELTQEVPETRIMLTSDRERVSQILGNFLSNACKYTKPGGKIKIRYEVEGDGVKISVIDTGIGISKEKFDHMFKRFEKLDTFAQGTGLGLSICRMLSEKMNGRVGFESEEGKGSTFWVWLPGVKR